MANSITPREQDALNTLQRLVNAYGDVVEKSAGQTICDLSALPAPKDVMKVTLLTAAKMCPPGNQRDLLKSGYVMLAHFQPLSDIQKKAVHQWDAMLRAGNDLKSFPQSVQNAVLKEVAGDVGNIYTQLTAKISEESQALLSDVKALGI